MKIEQANEFKAKLEDDIRHRINEFINDTNCRVTKVNISTIRLTDSYPKYFVNIVTTAIEL